MDDAVSAYVMDTSVVSMGFVGIPHISFCVCQDA